MHKEPLYYLAPGAIDVESASFQVSPLLGSVFLRPHIGGKVGVILGYLGIMENKMESTMVQKDAQ